MIYVIYNMENVSNINFSEIVQRNEETLRLSVDKTKTVLKFVGDTPAFLVGLQQYNHSEILEIIATPEWTNEEE